jgi:hypothetical protein
MTDRQTRTRRSWQRLGGAWIAMALAWTVAPIAGLGCQSACHTYNDVSTGPDHTPWTVDVAGFANESCTAAFSSSSATVTYSFLPVPVEAGAADAGLPPGDGECGGVALFHGSGDTPYRVCLD